VSSHRRADGSSTSCAHADYQRLLDGCYRRALADSFGKPMPHLFDQALSRHTRYLATKPMTP